ncbi:MAG: tetratricopeptide repeat protein [Mangrovibacterium sp.]
MKRITLLYIVMLAFSFSAFSQSARSKKETAISETPLSQEEKSEFEYIFIEALKQKQTGNFDAAQQLFARCLEIDPLSAVSMYEMGKLHYLRKDLTSAALLFERAIDVNPNNKWYRLTLAQAYQQLGKGNESAQLYYDLYQQDKENTKYLYTAALLWSKAKNYDAALKAYDEFAKTTGKYEAMALAKQDVYQKKGDFDTAIKDIQKLIKKNPTNTTYYGLLAELYHAKGDDKKALGNYNRILTIDPENGFVNISLAGFYLERGEKDLSFDYIKKAFRSERLSADEKMQFYLAEISREDEEESEWTTDQVDEILDILQASYPDDERMYAIYADHFMRQNKFEEARENLRKYLEKTPEAYELWWQYLLLSNQLEDWARLKKDCQEALVHFPEEATIYVWESLALLQLEDYAGASASSEKGLTFSEENAFAKEQLQVFIADANYSLGNVDEAITAYAEVIKANPNNFGALNNYAYYLAEVNRDLDKAETAANRVVQANPNNATYLDTYAWVLFKKGDYELALFYQDTAISNCGEEDKGVYLEHLGDILFKLGVVDKAMENWKKAKEAGDASELLDKKIEQRKYLEE